MNNSRSAPRGILICLVLAALISPGALISPASALADDNIPETVPDRAMVRKQIDTLIQSFQHQKKKATLGLVQQSIALSIAYGAPAWNQGDHGACYQFYADTADSLVAAFPTDDVATQAAATALADLKTARDRTRGITDIDQNAWTMRYAFDKTDLAWQAQVETATSLIQLGSDYFEKSMFAESQDAFESATGKLAELDGQSIDQIPIAARCGPLSLANALFAEKKYKEAAQAVEAGLKFVPQWPAATVDLRGLHHTPDEYEAIMDDLQAKAKADPTDANLQFLLGYEFYFTGKKASAKDQFEKTLKLDPDRTGAKLFLDFINNPDGAPNQPPIEPLTPHEAKDRVKT
jgi:tetratricopeptide (TPR) repeat protein